MVQKRKDIESIVHYIQTKNQTQITVSEITEYSGANDLRVSNILYELYLKGFLAVCSTSIWGVPVSYIVKKELFDYLP